VEDCSIADFSIFRWFFSASNENPQVGYPSYFI
jgi:hypothetical protein